MVGPVADATVKIEPKTEPDNGEYAAPFTFTAHQSPPDENTAGVDPVRKPAKRIPGPSRGRAGPKPILYENRRRLRSVLRDLVRSHNWKDASGVLSVLLRGTPRAGSAAEDRRNFLVAMELQKRFGARNYTLAIKQIYDVWMAKLAWTRQADKKKQSIHLELALFHLSQGNTADAHGVTKFLVQDPDSAREPTVNLIHGMILYHLWYSYLIQQMKIKGFDIDMSHEIFDAPSNDDNGDLETVESSDDHFAIDTKDPKISSQCGSESSVGNGRVVSKDLTKTVPIKQVHRTFPAQVFSVSKSVDINQEQPYSNNDNDYDSSIFFANGLDTTLLPMQLKFSGDIGELIRIYRGFTNEDYYRDAVKHLRIALYSTPPLLAALLPLIQLLLLGDRVEEALKELEQSCVNLNSALSFRLRARLMEAFHKNQNNLISSCYENVLKRDPTCNISLERLIRMHKTGNYSSMSLVEMVALHLDSANGTSSIWGELASCFLKLTSVTECEDCMSVNARRTQTNIISSRKVPKELTEGQTRDSWRVRCRWWVTRHFSKSVYLSEMHAGSWKLLSSKAACASHLYGPTFEYAIAVLGCLRKEGKSDQMSYLCTHMQNSMKLQENLA